MAQKFTVSPTQQRVMQMKALWGQAFIGWFSVWRRNHCLIAEGGVTRLFSYWPKQGVSYRYPELKGKPSLVNFLIRCNPGANGPEEQRRRVAEPLLHRLE